MECNYDILKRHPDGMFIWIETKGDLQAARERLKQLAARFTRGVQGVVPTHAPGGCIGERQIADTIAMSK